MKEKYTNYRNALDYKKIANKNKALYGVLLNESGGILDDLIIYHASDKFRLVSNCSTREQNFNWYKKHALDFGVEVVERKDMGILAIQGPEALKKILAMNEISSSVENLEPFECMFSDEDLYARTGYTGEDGLELIVSNDVIVSLWEKALAQGCTPSVLAQGIP